MESENQTFSYGVERARENSSSLLWSPINIINIEELCVQEWTSCSSAQHGQRIWLHVWRRDANLHSATFVYSKGTRGRDDHHEHASADCPTDKSSAVPRPGHLEPGRCAGTAGHSRWVASPSIPRFCSLLMVILASGSGALPVPPVLSHFLTWTFISSNKIIEHLILSWHLSTWEPRLIK